MNRIDRLVAIILLLQSQKLIRAIDIARHFGISIRTVYRDMNALCEAGIPVAAEAGEGYSLVEGYHLPPVMFTPQEASALSIGGKFTRQLTDASVRKNAESALMKITSVLPPETQRYLEKMQESTVLFTGPPPAQDGFREDILSTVQAAIVDQTVLSIEYYAHYRDSLSKRQIEPLGLLYYGSRWHLIAYCRLRKDYRDFRTDRIKTITLREESFPPRDKFSLKDYLIKFSAIDNPIEVKIKVAKNIVQAVREKYNFGLIKEEPFEDGLMMTFIVPAFQWMIPWLLSYGASVKIISPDSLRQSLLVEAKKLVEHYQED